MKNNLLYPFLSIILFTTFCDASTNGFVPRWDCNHLDCWELNVGCYAGVVNGLSKEKVYNPLSTNLPYKISELDWKIRNLWILGGIAQVNFLNDRLHICVDGWNKIHADKSKMVDRDFFNVNQPSVATEISWHPDTHLKTAFEIDTQLDYDFYCYHSANQEIKFGLLLGYKYQKFHWNAYGGHYSYANRTINGNFPPGELVIAYTQEFSIPYLGLQVHWKWKHCFEIRIFSKYTTLAYIQDHDFHALRNIHFVGKFRNAHYLGIGTEAIWNIYKCLNLDFRYRYEHLNNTTGDATEIFDNSSFSSPDSVGIEHNHHLLSIGLSASF